MLVADIGFLLAAVGFTLLTLLLLTVRVKNNVKRFLLASMVATTVWAMLSTRLLFPNITLEQFLVIEYVKQLFWLLFLSAALHNQMDSIKQLLQQRSTQIGLLLPCVGIVLLLIPQISINWSFLLLTVVALAILLKLELIFRQAGSSKWAFKPLVIFLGITNVFEFVSFANATMLEYMDVNFIQAKGFVYAFSLPALLLAIRRMDHWGIRIFISREIVLHSTLLFVAGAYLFVMAALGYLIKFMGGEWTVTIQIVLGVFALFFMVVILASVQFRQKLKVFITKNFFANQFDYREQWIALSQTLSIAENELPDVYHTSLVGIMQSVEYDAGVMYKCEKNGLKLVAQHNIDNITPIDDAVMQASAVYCQERPWLVDLFELMVHPELYEGLDIEPGQAKQSQFQFVLPLYKNSQLWGITAIYAKQAEGRHLNWELRDYLNVILTQVANFVLHHESSKTLAENAQFAAFSRMSAFVVHDLKNVLAQVDLILSNAQQHKDNPEFIADTFETLEYTQARMSKMLKQLTEKQVQQQESSQPVDLSSILKSVIEKQCATLLPTPLLSINQHCTPSCSTEKLSNVFYHLISNAQQATDDKGSVAITVSQPDAGFVVIEISDSGCGMTDTFIKERLFRPFDTTKGNAGMGIGAYDAKHYIEEIGGDLAVTSEVGKGTTFTLKLPCHDADSYTKSNKEV